MAEDLVVVDGHEVEAATVMGEVMAMVMWEGGEEGIIRITCTVPSSWHRS